MKGRLTILGLMAVAATAAAFAPAAAPDGAVAPPAASQPATTQSSTTHPSSTQSATQPATAPATVPAQVLDLSTPKAALRAFAAALNDGDGGRLHQVVATTNPSEDRMIRAMADMAAALAGLHQSASKAFGDPAAAKFTGDPRQQFADSLARIDTAEIAVDGDAASVRYPGAAEPEYQLKRIDGKWKIPITQFSHGADAPTLDRRITESSVQTRIVLELAAEIAAGKYRNADAATDAWRGKIMQALGLRVPTTTTTAPVRD